MDKINPSYYQKGKCTCGKSLQTYDFVKDLPFGEGSAIKYIVRHKDKGKSDDVKKALWLVIAILIREYDMTPKDVLSFTEDLLIKGYGQ
jgi:hypothetical protein